MKEIRLSGRPKAKVSRLRHPGTLRAQPCIIGRLQTWSAFCEFSDVIESFTAKEEDGLTSFLILDFLEAKIF